MIFLDTNYVLRYLTQPDSPKIHVMHERASALFAAVERGELEVTTSEAVLAEVAFVLASKLHYHLSAETIATLLGPIIRMRGLKLSRGRKRLYLRALDIWAVRPSLGFVDSLTVATVEETEIDLATFDRHFNAMTHVRLLGEAEEL